MEMTKRVIALDELKILNEKRKQQDDKKGHDAYRTGDKAADEIVAPILGE